MYFITSASATNKIISNTVSVKYITPFHKGAGTTAAVPLQEVLYHIYFNLAIIGNIL